MLKPIQCLLSLLLLTFPAQPLWAQEIDTDTESNPPRLGIWAASEFQLMLSPETDPDLAWHDIIPDRLRVYTEYQIHNQIGLNQAVFRVGPIWNLQPWFSYAMHLSGVAMQPRSEYFVQELRFEAEPLFQGQLFELVHWMNRHRIEYRLRSDQSRWRYRTRLAVNLDFPDNPWTPFLSSEVFFEQGNGFNQNRNQLGLSYQINKSMRISLSYLLRLAQNQGSWSPENSLVVNLSYSSQEDGIFQMQAD